MGTNILHGQKQKKSNVKIFVKPIGFLPYSESKTNKHKNKMFF